MAIRMLWFLPVGVLTGLGGTNLSRYLLRQGGSLHRLEIRFLLVLSWLPLAAWLLNQMFNFER